MWRVSVNMAVLRACGVGVCGGRFVIRKGSHNDRNYDGAVSIITVRKRYT